MRELFEFYGILHFEDFSDVCNDTGIYLILFFIILGIIYSSIRKKKKINASVSCELSGQN